MNTVHHPTFLLPPLLPPPLLRRFYNLLLSLTGILSPSLVFSNEKTMERDTVIHKLWESRIKGNMTQFNRFYQPCHKRLTMYCLGKLRDIELAENAASETLVKMLEQDNLEDIRDIDSWIFTVARNKCLTHLNKENNRRDIRERISGTFEKQQNPEGEQLLKKEDLEKTIRETLSERDHEIWQWHLKGFRNDEIAERMSIPEKTIANRKTEARKLLQKALARYHQ